MSTDKSAAVEVGEQPLRPRKSYLRELAPWSGINPGSSDNPNFFFLLIRPWPLAIYPAVIYSFLVFSFNLACLLCIVNTAPVVFQSPPYNFSPGIQSLIFLSAFVGASIGAFAGGALTDWIIQWHTKRNNGIFEPESRLLALVLPFFLVPTGVLMYDPITEALIVGISYWVLAYYRYGLGVANLLSWPCAYIGFGFVMFGLGSLPTITMTYGTHLLYFIHHISGRLLLFCGPRSSATDCRIEKCVWVWILVWSYSMGYRVGVCTYVWNHRWNSGRYCVVGITTLVFWEEIETCDGKVEDHYVVIQLRLCFTSRLAHSLTGTLLGASLILYIQ